MDVVEERAAAETSTAAVASPLGRVKVSPPAVTLEVSARNHPAFTCTYHATCGGVAEAWMSSHISTDAAPNIYVFRRPKQTKQKPPSPQRSNPRLESRVPIATAFRVWGFNLLRIAVSPDHVVSLMRYMRSPMQVLLAQSGSFFASFWRSVGLLLLLVQAHTFLPPVQPWPFTSPASVVRRSRFASPPPSPPPIC